MIVLIPAHTKHQCQCHSLSLANANTKDGFEEPAQATGTLVPWTGKACLIACAFDREADILVSENARRKRLVNSLAISADWGTTGSDRAVPVQRSAVEVIRPQHLRARWNYGRSNPQALVLRSSALQYERVCSGLLGFVSAGGRHREID
jgi:hypothetical protein